MFLTELAEPQLLVIYPGRFQPFHKGHYAVYEWLTGKFGRNNVYIATSNKHDESKSPFNFAEKAYFMQLTGVPADRIVQAAQPYKIEDILSGGHITVADPANTVVVFAVSQKDMDEDPRFSFKSKKDGSKSYFQPLKNIRQTDSMQQHGYIMVVPTFDFTVAGESMNSASEIRQLYADSDQQQRQQIVKDLFGHYTREAEQVMNNKLAPAEPVAEPKLQKSVKLQKVKEPKQQPDEEPMAEGKLKNAEIDRQWQATQSMSPATVEVGRYKEGFWIPIKQHTSPDSKTAHSQAIAHAQNIKKKYPSIEVGVKSQDGQVKLVGLNETGGVGVVRGGNDPRYVMSTAGDQNAVTGATLGKEMRAFGLTGRKNPGATHQQKKVKSNVGQGIRETREPYQQAIDKLTLFWVQKMNDDIDYIKGRLATEQLSAEYRETLKQKIKQIETDRNNLVLGKK